MTHKEKKISVIGGGVSGITCALLLQKLGFETIVYSKEDLLSTKRTDPTLVSLFPAASIIPHSVVHPDLNSIFSNSQAFFEELSSNHFNGLSTHLHYELFTGQEELPDYVRLMKDFRILEQSELPKVPSHPSIATSFGYQFDCFFADWGIYFPHLIKAYQKAGGTIRIKKISRDQLQNLGADIIINCTGFGGPELAGEKSNPVIHKGHLVHIKEVPKLKDASGRIVSYNFVPGYDHYHSQKGVNLDVYCYSREDTLVLGGSRLTGTFTDQEDWMGEEIEEPTSMVGNVALPEQIISINKEIIKHTFGVDLDSYPDREAYIGYRFMGNNKAGLRLETEETFDRLLIHNYGHGGAGVSLSWGCAFEIAAMISHHLNRSAPTLKKALTILEV